MEMDKARMMAIHEQITVRLKKRIVEAARGPQDVNPALFVTLADGTHHVGRPIPQRMGENFDLPQALAVDVFLLWCDKGVPVERIIVSMDAYVQMVEGQEEAERIRHGDLGKDFRTNPNSNVQEGCVTAYIWHHEGRYFGSTCTQGYVFTEGGVLQWGEPRVADVIDLEDEAGYGAVMDAALAVMQVVREETA